MLDLGYAIGMSIAIVLLAAAAVAIGIAARKHTVATRQMAKAAGHSSTFDQEMTRDGAKIVIGIAAAVAALTIVFTLIASWPTFDMQYHTWRPVSGTVASANARLRADGKAATQSYAIRFVGNPTIYRCDDTRCALTKPGTKLRLQCTRDWQYASTPGWDCRYDQAG